MPDLFTHQSFVYVCAMLRCVVFFHVLPCSDNQAARNCISKAEAAQGPKAKHDPYLRLTHANVIMAMLPSGRFSNLSPQDKAKHYDYITKVGCGWVSVGGWVSGGYCRPSKHDRGSLHHPFDGRSLNQQPAGGHELDAVSDERSPCLSISPAHSSVCVCVVLCSSMSHLVQALGLYREVVKAHPDNIYAVNGVGTCLAGKDTGTEELYCP